MDAPPAAPSARGWGALRSAGNGLLAGLQERIDLFSIEVREEKLRFLSLLLWLGATLIAAVMTLGLLSLTVVFLFWQKARLLALGGLALLYGLAFCFVLLGFRRRLAKQPKPFAATLEEIGRDRACFHPRN